MEHRVMNTSTEQSEFDFSIVRPKLTLEAMRDSGYKDTNHALAELIDNSVEANAELIEVVAIESQTSIDSSRWYVSEIAVIDDGDGMDKKILRQALKFGDGTKLNRSKRGIGRFGIGLPQSSISQCKRVDIWSWQNGSPNAFHCWMDFDEIKSNDLLEVPEPVLEAVPDKWLKISENVSKTQGTIVIWSKLDRVKWSGGKKNLDKTEELCGRIYRKFLTGKNKIDIQLRQCRLVESELTITKTWNCLPNDPLYVSVPSSAPKPFDQRPMFKRHNSFTWTIPVGNKSGNIHVRTALAIEDAIKKTDSSQAWYWPESNIKAGHTPWGKHADRNKGVSIVRAKRELDLSLAWCNSHEPEERWWSVEVEFDPILDEIFGVTNNKQNAHIFVDGAKFNWEEYKEDDKETYGALLERLEDNEDPKFHLIPVWKWINDQITEMRRLRASIMKGTNSARHPKTNEKIEDVVTTVIKKQSEKGEWGNTDRAPKISDEEKKEKIAESAKKYKLSDDEAMKLAVETIVGDRRMLIKSVTLGHQNAFFQVGSVSDVIELWLNYNHPVHKHLFDVLKSNDEQLNSNDQEERLKNAAFALLLLLAAWARYEDKIPNKSEMTIEDFRMDWGREARKFLDVIES